MDSNLTYTTDLSDILGKAWKKTTENLTILIGLQLVFYIALLLFTILIAATQLSMPVFSFVINLLSMIIQVVFSVGMIRICLLIMEGNEVRTKDIFPTLAQGIRYLLTNLLIAFLVIIIFLGILSIFQLANPDFMIQNKWNQYILGFFVAIPVVALYLRFLFAGYFIVDADSAAMESLMKSFIITKDHVGKLLLMLLLIIGINLIGIICLLIGLFITIPMSMFIISYMYRGLREAYEPRIISPDNQ